MIQIKESTREREAFRYAPRLYAESTIHTGQTPPDPSILKPSADTALTAFAQLGALRLQATRALISLFDRQYQHVIAEATCSSRLGPAVADNGDEDTTSLWLGGIAFSRQQSVCERVLATEFVPRPADARTHLPSAEEIPVLIVPDLTADAALTDSPYLGPRRPEARFYAGVPIRSRRGIDIGVFCVLGPEPRESLDAASIRFLQDMSRTTMAHLEMAAESRNHQRSARMVRGLGSLIEGKGSMSKWWLGDSTASFVDTLGAEGNLNAKQQTLQHIDEEQQMGSAQSSAMWRDHLAAYPAAEGAATSPPADDSNRQLGRQPVPNAASGSDTTADSVFTTRSDAGAGGDNVSTAGTSERGKSDPSTQDTTTGSIAQPQEDESLVTTRALLSRGANIIRESIQCEGVLFLDATVSSFGGLVDEPDSDPTSSGESLRELTASGSDGTAKQPTSPPDEQQPALMCAVLGYSTSDTASIDGDLASTAHLSVPERFLKRLLRRYPEGHVFNFDESGAAQSGDSSEDDSLYFLTGIDAAGQADAVLPPRRRTRPLKPSDSEMLVRTFTGARSIALVPLWDSEKERWFAGGFIWTRTPTRVFTNFSEMSYLKAFGMAVMGEVSRADALRANKAKADVLGSVSHELRSPLHGIVLGIELLQDTRMDAFQEDLLHTLETCGRTLVDTINHLLDFSKINRYVRVSRRRAGGRNRGVRRDGEVTIEAGMMNLYSDISLDLLVEEVVESVYAGFSYQQLSGALGRSVAARTSEFARANTMRRLGSLGPMETPDLEFFTSRTPTSAVTVYLDIDPSVGWMFYAQPGAIRRVIMNLFGNALKYTTRGSILVSLTQDSVPEGRKSARRGVTLSISDSGKGIGADFLRTQLFTSFAQEDHLAAGVGLGLSLVKQIVTSMGGRIGVDSQVGRGTTVRAFLPLRHSRRGAADTATPAEADFRERVGRLKGLSVCIVGFDKDGSVSPNFIAATSSPNPKTAVERACRDWLLMDVVPTSETESPSFYICSELGVGELPIPTKQKSRPSPVIVVCRSASVAHELATSYQSPVEGRIYEFISQPPGVRKLARILDLTLKKWHQPLPSSPQPEELNPGPDITPATSVSAPLSPSIDSPNPATAPAIRPSPHNDPVAPASDESGFLLVDDNEINLKVLSSYMKKSGRTYGTAVNGLEALDAYRQNPEKYRCVMMDISMPVMDGLESTRLIREFERQNHLKPTIVIALTGLASASAQREAFASGIDIFLSKPVAFTELKHILDSKGL